MLNFLALEMRLKYKNLQIKALKCSKDNSRKINTSVAYLQVRDLSENQNEKVLFLMAGLFLQTQRLLLLTMQFTIYN